MKMELTHPQLPNDWEGYPKKVFDILNQTLQLPGDPKSVGAKLAQDVISMDENGKYLEPVLETIWEVILIIVRYIPPGYPWQQSLFELVSILRRREGHCKQDDRKYITREKALWKNLPGFHRQVGYVWNSDLPVSNLDFDARRYQRRPGDANYNIEGTGEEMMKRFVQWKNFCSFTIKVLCEDPFLEGLFPVWHMRMVLETSEWPGSTQEKRDCQLWTATEWFIRSSDKVLKVMMPHHDDVLDRDGYVAYHTGDLCGAIKSRSVERWAFWKKQLAAYLDAQQVSKEVADRISTALANMDAAEEKKNV